MYSARTIRHIELTDHAGKLRPRIEHPQQVRKGGDAANRRAGCRGAALLLQGDGRRQSFDFVNDRLLQLMEQAAGVGGDRFQIAPLGLRVEGAERQRRFARTGHASEHDQRIARHIDVDVLQVMRAGPADADEPGAGVAVGGWIRLWHADLGYMKFRRKRMRHLRTALFSLPPFAPRKGVSIRGAKGDKGDCVKLDLAEDNLLSDCLGWRDSQAYDDGRIVAAP